jgi:hypothetical protein
MQMMKQYFFASRNTIKVIYVTAGIFFIIGIYMYIFGIEAIKGSLPSSGVKGRLPSSLNGKAVIILAFITALCAAALNYKRKKPADNQL